ncbi:MAG: glycosyltransferase [Planctomycetota bacterium]|nr:MAG: glycosyltransferase [Planctomycetota bacterium]
MTNSTDVRRIALVGDYLPRKCGIATYTYDLRQALAGRFPAADVLVVPVNDIAEGYEYPAEVRFEIQEQELDGYRRAADYLNFNDVDVVCLQHEYGIFGGPAGRYVLTLLRDVHAPVVTTLHTVLEEPNDDQRNVLLQIAELSARLIVMTERGRKMLQEIYHVPAEKIDVIPHGIPDMPFVDPNFYKDQFQVEGKNVLLTFGLLSPNKGIEYVLQAMPRILERFPDTVYIVLGATHPNLVREQGETYRLMLRRLAEDLGVERNVLFYNRFVDLKELTEFIGAADIYITPYLNRAQITSGTLAYSFGCGKAVISTPYWHAEELLADGRGVLVPPRDSHSIAEAVIDLLDNEPKRHAMRKRAYLLGRDMIWPTVAGRFMESFQRARHSATPRFRHAQRLKSLDEQSQMLPAWRFDHLLRMTDKIGMFQHAKYALPDYQHGYCTDDNSRALALTVLLEELGQLTPQLKSAQTSYAAFVNHAFDPQTHRFHNFMAFDRSWLARPEDESDDCLGRAIWALGTCVGRSGDRSLQMWAAQLFDRSLEAITHTTSPRAWAFALIGIHEYLRRLSGDRKASLAREHLAMRLLELYERTASQQWLWLEDIVSYSNAKLPHALILSGRWMGNETMQAAGLRALEWLCSVQKSPAGHFRPIGNAGFYRRGETPALYDQQPIEAHATVSACIEAYHTTGDARWLQEARLAFEWFLGRNDLGEPLYDTRTGGCRDGLHEDRLNENQGAESTLAFLLSLAECYLLESVLAMRQEAGNRTAPAAQPAT